MGLVVMSPRLYLLKGVITAKLKGIADVAEALREIHDERLYLEEAETFEAFCQQNWGIERSRAYQLLDFARVRGAILSTTVDIEPPARERQARPLSALPPHEQGEAWKQAVETAPDGEPTGKHIEAVVALRGMSKDEQRSLVQHFDADVILARNKELRRTRTRESFHSKESVEWYSPSGPVDLARQLMGGIDLDPASSPEANDVVRAERIFTAEDNGLAQEWPGRVWLNWPGGLNDDDESNAALWSAKLLAEFAAKRTTEAVVMLFNAATDRGWFRPLWGHALCFVYGRLRFRRPGGEIGNQPLQPNGLVYLGPQVGRFAELFAPIGRIVVPRGACSSEALP